MLKILIRDELALLLQKTINCSIELLQLETPRQKLHGDFATNIAFMIAKDLKKSPKLIAEEIADNINKLESKNFELVALNGFINIRLSDEFIWLYVKDLFKNKPDFPKLAKKINLEFVSANPTGPLHIGHGRWAVIGSAIANLLQVTGQNFDTETYINDAGVQIKNLLLSIEAVKEGRPLPEDGYHGDYIKELAFSNHNPVEFLLEQHKTTLKKIDVTFDCWFSEKSLYDKQQIDAVIQFLNEQGYIYINDGATWFRSTDFSDDKDRVLIKSDGAYTYFLVDIAYHFNKIQRGYDSLINIWGADHHGYVPRMAAAIAALSNKGKVDFKVIIGQLVNLFRDGIAVRMSKRSGDIISLDEVIDEIGADATRYFLLEKSADSTLDFDLSLALQKNSENPVFYVQYAHARMNSLLTKIETDCSASFKVPELEAEERQLLYACACFYDEVWESTKNFAPYKLLAYSYTLAKSFHGFYESCPIQNAEKDQQQKRLQIVSQCKLVLSESLTLLGISSPERM